MELRFQILKNNKTKQNIGEWSILRRKKWCEIKTENKNVRKLKFIEIKWDLNCNFHIHSNEKTRTNLQHHKYYYGLHEFETNWINGWHFGGYDQKGKVIDEMNPLNMRIRMILMRHSKWLLLQCRLHAT